MNSQQDLFGNNTDVHQDCQNIKADFSLFAEKMRSIEQGNISMPVSVAAKLPTDCYAPSSQGLFVYHSMVGVAFEFLKSIGWLAKIDRNLPVCAHMESNSILLFRTGGEGCGTDLSASMYKVLPRKFGAQSALYATGEKSIAPYTESLNVHILLFRYDKLEETLYWELSIPEKVIDGKVVSWKERMLLPPVHFQLDAFHIVYGSALKLPH